MTTAAEIKHLQENGLYSSANEHDACGVGFVVDMKGRATHQILQQGLKVLTNLDHRGASGAEVNTGDGAGILVLLLLGAIIVELFIGGWPAFRSFGVGFAWASILSLPYALLSDSVPASKMGVYMGIFNFFIVIPQLVAASALGFALRAWLGGKPMHVLVLGGCSLFVAGLCVLRVPSRPEVV